MPTIVREITSPNDKSRIEEVIDYKSGGVPYIMLWFQGDINGVICFSVNPPYLCLGRFHGKGVAGISVVRMLRAIGLANGCTKFRSVDDPIGARFFKRYGARMVPGKEWEADI